MDSLPLHLTSSRRPAWGLTASGWRAASLLVLLALGLSACDRRSESNPGSTPAAVGSDSPSREGREAGVPGSDEVEVRTPVAPDARGGGSSGFKGSVPTPDTSGGPSSGSTSPGPSSSDPAPDPRSLPASAAR